MYYFLPLVSLHFSSIEKKPKISGGKVKYKTRNIHAVSRNLNMGKKSIHVRFDQDGNELVAKPSRTLKKVKNFLGKMGKDVEVDLCDKEIIDIFSVKGLKRNEYEDKNSGSNEIQKEDHQQEVHDVMETGTHTDIELAKLEEESGMLEGCAVKIDKGKPFDFSAENNSSSGFPVDRLEHSEVFHFTGTHKEDEINESPERQAVEYDLELWKIEEDNDLKSGSKKKKGTSRKRRKNKGGNPMPVEIAEDPELRKYWGQRYRLFSKFDEGVKLDRGNLVHYLLKYV